MAGERKGITYEAIVKIALSELVQRGKLQGKIFWNERPDTMTIEPDFTVGPERNRPTHVFLVSHINSAKNSDMKFWRNMGELAEAKVRLPTMPRVYSVVFDSTIKPDLKALQNAAFDGQLIVGDREYGNALLRWIEDNASELPLDNAKKETILRELIKKGRREGSRILFSKFVRDLRRLLQINRPDLDKLWSLERNRKHGIVPQARQTSVRRGLSKLLIFEDVEAALRLYRRRSVPLREVPAYAFSLGLAKRSIAGACPSDPDVMGAVTLLSDEDIRRVVTRVQGDWLTACLFALRRADHLVAMSTYVQSSVAELSNGRKLAILLDELAQNSNAIQATTRVKDWPPPKVWLIEFLLELIRLSTGSANGYGYAQLAQEVSRLPGLPRAGDRVYSIVLSDWIHRRGKETLPKSLLQAIAQTLSARLLALGRERVVELAKEVSTTISKHLIEAKLVTYRMFDPLGILIEHALPNAIKTKVQSCFAEAVALGGQGGFTSLLRVGGTLINWQSCSDAGRDHKKKELCGRAPGLRYTWNSETKTFVPRPGVRKLALVLDGTWRQEDLETLVRAGWDEICYPDEMNKLTKAIV